MDILKRGSTIGNILILSIFYIIGYLLSFSFVFLIFWLAVDILSDLLVIGCLLISIILAIPITIMLLFIIAIVFVD